VIAAIKFCRTVSDTDSQTRASIFRGLVSFENIAERFPSGAIALHL
jgi:hypothetical protein